MTPPSIGEEARDVVVSDTQPDTGQLEPNSHWKDAPNRKCYSSFGDDGTTATVNAFGDIMQFSKYIGKGHSGMFSADHQCVSKPFSVEARTNDLQDLIGQSNYDREKTYGAHFPGLSSLFGPELTFVHNRWPRFDDVLAHDWHDTVQKEYNNFPKFDDLRAHLRSESSGLSKFSTAWMVFKGIVFQHCVASNNSSAMDLPIKIHFEENMLIRDLDHLESDYPINGESDEEMRYYHTFFGSEGKSWVRLHQLDRACSVPSSEKEVRCVETMPRTRELIS
jgi:hypothetical protein